MTIVFEVFEPTQCNNCESVRLFKLITSCPLRGVPFRICSGLCDGGEGSGRATLLNREEAALRQDVNEALFAVCYYYSSLGGRESLTSILDESGNH